MLSILLALLLLLFCIVVNTKHALAKRFAKRQNVDKESTDEAQFLCIIPNKILEMNCHILILHNTSSQYTRAGVLGVPTTAGELEDD